MRTLVATSIFFFPRIGVATSIRCRDPTLSAFTAFLCRDPDLMSRPHFCCHPLCFSVTAPIFMLRCHSVVLNLQAGRDSSLLVCLFSCCDVVIRSNQVVSLISAIPVVTSIPCRDLAVLLSTTFYVATLIRCHDLISFVSN